MRAAVLRSYKNSEVSDNYSSRTIDISARPEREAVEGPSTKSFDKLRMNGNDNFRQLALTINRYNLNCARHVHRQTSLTSLLPKAST